MRDHMEKLMDYPNRALSSSKRVLTTRWHPSVTDAVNLSDWSQCDSRSTSFYKTMLVFVERWELPTFHENKINCVTHKNYTEHEDSVFLLSLKGKCWKVTKYISSVIHWVTIFRNVMLLYASLSQKDTWRTMQVRHVLLSYWLLQSHLGGRNEQNLHFNRTCQT